MHRALLIAGVLEAGRAGPGEGDGVDAAADGAGGDRPGSDGADAVWW